MANAAKETGGSSGNLVPSSPSAGPTEWRVCRWNNEANATNLKLSPKNESRLPAYTKNIQAKTRPESTLTTIVIRMH